MAKKTTTNGIGDLKALFTQYFAMSEEIDAAKKTIADTVTRRSEIAKKIVELTGKKSFTINGQLYEHRARRHDKDDPNTLTTHFFITKGETESLEVTLD